MSTAGHEPVRRTQARRRRRAGSASTLAGPAPTTGCRAAPRSLGRGLRDARHAVRSCKSRRAAPRSARRVADLGTARGAAHASDPQSTRRGPALRPAVARRPRITRRCRVVAPRHRLDPDVESCRARSSGPARADDAAPGRGASQVARSPRLPVAEAAASAESQLYGSSLRLDSPRRVTWRSRVGEDRSAVLEARPFGPVDAHPAVGRAEPAPVHRVPSTRQEHPPHAGVPATPRGPYLEGERAARPPVTPDAVAACERRSVRQRRRGLRGAGVRSPPRRRVLHRRTPPPVRSAAWRTRYGRW